MTREQFEKDLMATPLLEGAELKLREEMAECFAMREFEAGEPIIRMGSPDRHLALLLHGRAVVKARRGEHTYAVALLEPGHVFGEMAFFDEQAPRTADVVALEPGCVALLDWRVYQQMLTEKSQGIEILEKNVLDLLAYRMKATNDRLATLLDATRSGGLLTALRRLFGVEK